MALRRYKLPQEFLDSYKDKQPPWGFMDPAGNSMGEITFLRSYSRLKEDGSKETWADTVQRVIEGMFTIQREHCRRNQLPWDYKKAQRTAQDAYDRMFNFKWLPAGRGIANMGAPFIIDDWDSTPLMNCAFVSTKIDYSEAMHFLMLASMNGVGVGIDVLGAGKYTVRERSGEPQAYVIPDTREGWADALKALIDSHLQGGAPLDFDYSEIRPKGALIKRFGGTASGPESLKFLLDWIDERMASRQGDALTATDIADIANQIGVCVVSGSSRRSAELLLGPQTEEYMDLKDYEKNPHRGSYGWMSNNSVFAEVGQDYTEVAERTVINGEPGYIWMDTTRGFGRMKDGRDNKDWRAAGYNPSLTAGTRVFTTDGVKNIEDLENKDFKVRNLDGRISDAYCWKSGVGEDVYRLSLEGGHEYEATKEHKWPVWDGERFVKKGTLDLREGDLLPNLQESSLYPEGTRGTYDEGFLIGWNLGDGWITRRPAGLQIGFMVSPEDRASGIDERLLKSLRALGVNTNFDGKDEINVNNNALRKLFSDYDVRHKSEGLPASVWNSEFSDEYRKGIIDGLFSADGAMGTRVSLSQASEKMVRDVSSLLGFFGVKSNVMKLELAASRAFPEHYGEDQKDRRLTRWTLGIGTHENISRFANLFSLSHTKKQKFIEDFLRDNKPSNHKSMQRFVKVKGVEAAGQADVWDVTVKDDTHAFQIDHCVTGNCAEQPLESYETCNLVETYPTRAESVEDYLKTLKVAYLYGKTVTLLPTVFERTNAIQMRNRRIGLSQSGITTYVEEHGIAAWRQLSNAGYKEVQRLDEVYSDWLTVRNSIRTTTVKPSGTISLLTGDSPGVHWNPAAGYYLRRVTMGDGPLLDSLIDANYPVEPSAYSKGQYVVSFPVKSPFKRSEKDVSIWEKTAMAAESQFIWSDNSVSCTVSYNPETEAHHIKSILSIYEGQLKTISFLPMDKTIYKQMPYEEINEETYEKLTSVLVPIERSEIYLTGEEAIGEKYCSTAGCEADEFMKAMEDAEKEKAN